MLLDERKQKILKAIIDSYVASAEPVGSKALVAKYKLGISSATVRNEMAELLELGYLEQPHRSAGRIPTDKAYRAYVDNMLKLQTLPSDDCQAITAALGDKKEITSVIKKAALVLAEQTEMTSLVLTPYYNKTALKQIKILMIEPGKALVVVVLSAGIVKDRLISVPNILNSEDLADIATSIESSLAGTKINDITFITLTKASTNDLPIPESILNQVLFEAYVSIKQAENIDVYTKGTHHLLSQPEFSDTKKAHRFLSTLSEQKLVAGYLKEMNGAGENQLVEQDKSYLIRIGQEITLEGLEDCSFITSTYRFGDTISGKIGVIGPRRMDYARIISQVSFINRTLTKQIESLCK